MSRWPHSQSLRRRLRHPVDGLELGDVNLKLIVLSLPVTRLLLQVRDVITGRGKVIGLPDVEQADYGDGEQHDSEGEAGSPDSRARADGEVSRASRLD
jgi:hypothetical protein